MPRLINKDDTMDVISIPGPGSFQFSAVRPEALGATEYTLVTMVVDTTGSVSDFATELLRCIKDIVKACQKSPRAENLLLRLMTFNNTVNEVHGFKLLSDIDTDNYKALIPAGRTALIDATYESITATLTYAKTLMDQDFNVNGAVYIITDGFDNESKLSNTMIAQKCKEARDNELIESLITILVGINTYQYKQELGDFKKQADLTDYVDIGDATPQRLAKLAAFVSKSISSQSQALGTGSASQQLTF
jgi:hypothetical protein